MSHVDILTAHSTKKHKLSDGRFVEIKLIEFCVIWPDKDAEMRLIARQDVGNKEREVVQTSDGTCVVSLVPTIDDIHYEAARLLLSYATQYDIAAHQLHITATMPAQSEHVAYVYESIYELSPLQERMLLRASHLANTTAESVKKLADKAGHRLKDGASALSHKLRKSHHDDA